MAWKARTLPTTAESMATSRYGWTSPLLTALRTPTTTRGVRDQLAGQRRKGCREEDEREREGDSHQETPSEEVSVVAGREGRRALPIPIGPQVRTVAGIYAEQPSQLLALAHIVNNGARMHKDFSASPRHSDGDAHSLEVRLIRQVHVGPGPLGQRSKKWGGTE